MSYPGYHAFCFLVLFAVFVMGTLPIEENENSRILPPIAALNIGTFVEEPSGLTFCNITGHLYAICDKPKCHYIYEMLTNGTPVQSWEIGKNHDDIEAVACDDKKGIIYVAEEENMRISAYVFPDPSNNETFVNLPTKNSPQLIPVSNFTLPTHGGDSNSGLEGLTIDTKRDLIYTVYEKKPRMFYTLTPEGRELNLTYTYFSGDLSGLAYDDRQDKLWVLSDQSNRVFLTDVTCSIVYDYWDLPVLHSEGIAINYNVDPAELYITTDPSSPTGAPYVPIMVTFLLPKIGTGLKFPDNPNVLGTVNCIGCDEVWEEIFTVEKNFNEKVQHQELIYALELVACIAIIFVPIIIIMAVLFVRKIQQYDPSSYPSTPQKKRKSNDGASLWGDIFSSREKKEKTYYTGVVPGTNFEDQNF